MKANSLEELVTNSNIAGELRNYTDWHTRLVKFAQLVADWQKEQMLKDAFMDNYVVHDGRIEMEGDPLPSLDPILLLPYPQFKPNDKVKLIIVKED